jgi:selenocysteine lyase/cysteine desulfurase
MAAAASTLMGLGMDAVADHENELVAYALERLARVPGLSLYGETDPLKSRDKVGVIPFNLAHGPHALVSAILGYEGGIGVRHGCFCAHPYVVHLLGLSESETAKWHEQIGRGDKSEMPGMVRASFGCYNTLEDIDRLAGMLERIARGDYHGRYRQLKSGEYVPEGVSEEQYDEYFAVPEPDSMQPGPGPRACGG